MPPHSTIFYLIFGNWIFKAEVWIFKNHTSKNVCLFKHVNQVQINIKNSIKFGEMPNISNPAIIIPYHWCPNWNGHCNYNNKFISLLSKLLDDVVTQCYMAKPKQICTRKHNHNKLQISLAVCHWIPNKVLNVCQSPCLKGICLTILDWNSKVLKYLLSH